MSVEPIQRLKLENAKLQKELAFACTLLESANSIVIRWGKDGIIHYMNDFGLRFFGYSAEELIGQHLLTIAPEIETSTGRDMSQLAKAIAHNPDQYKSVPSENLTKDGRTVWVTWTNKGILDEQGNVLEVLAIGNDITALKKASQKLLVYQKTLDAALASMDDAVFVSDNQGNFVHFNQAFATFHRFKNKKECLDRLADYPKILDIFQGDGERLTLDQWVVARALRGESATNSEYILRRRDTGESWVGSYNFGPFHDEQGNIAGAVVVARDITARKQIEDKLRFSEKRSLAYLENSPACTKILDLEFNLQFMSEAGVKGLNIDNIEDYYGKPYPFYFYPESFKKEMRGNLELAKETGEIITQEAAVVDVNGNEIWFHSTIVPVSDDEGELDYLMVVSIDTTDRKQIEEEFKNALAAKSSSEALLQASEAQIRALLEQAPMGIALIDSLNGQLYDINQRFAEIVGRSREDLLALDWMTITHPDDIQPDLDNMARLNAGEISGFNMQKRYIHADTSIVWVSLTVAPITVSEKTRPRHVAMVEDITEKKRAEDERVKSQQLLQQMGKISLVGGWEFDIDTGEQKWTEEVHHILEVTLDYVPKVRECIDFYSDTSKPVIAAAVQRAIEHGEPYDLELELITAKGNIRNVHVIGMADLKNRRIYGTLQDITERTFITKELEKQKTTFETLLESIPYATVLVDQERRIIKINKTFTEIFGYTLDEMVGKPTSVFYESEEEFLRQGRLRYNLSTKEASAPYIVTYRRKDGSLFPGETIGTKAFTPEGRLLGFFGLMRDVSDKLKQEEAHRQSQKMEAIGTLSGGIAHDFNNLLAILSSNIDIVQHKQQTGTSSEENIGNLKETVSRAKRLVTQILAFSRQEKHEFSPIDLSIVIADSLKLLRSTIPTTIEISFEVESEFVFVNANTVQLQQVLINLCTNAVHAMEEKGLLKVRLGKIEPESQELPEGLIRPPGSYAKLTVSDTGSGIEKENIDRIFDPFFTSKDVGTGTGMGLSVVYGIVEQHGGVITVDSTPGQGTTFNIYLPSIEGQQHEPKVNTEDSLPTGTERILFVDDEEFIAESCRELLEYRGYTVTSTTSSSEALEFFKKSPEDFDLVVTDQTMPKMTGVELAKELLKIRPNVPIVLCSGFAAKVSEGVAKGIGIREFCMKPMDIKQLATVVRKVLDENESSPGKI